MKKILFFLLLAVVFGACDNDTDSNWNGRPGWNDDTQNWDTYTITVDKWERIGGANTDNSYFRCIVEDKYLDQNIFENGSVMVYLIQYDGQTPVKTPLPYVMHYADGDNLWTETYSYDYSVGSFAFYVTSSDFYTEDFPAPCQFRVVMHW
ncbi:hypothetical protein [Bacteroides sp.]